MKTQAYFENIQQQIKTELLKANSSIKIAVAWFTDFELFNTLCQKAEEGLEVELILMNDEINNNSGINYNLLKNVKGKTWLIDSSKETPLMHNKFCIIDNNVIINGSYNWTNKAKSNYESITIIKEDNDLADDFINEFNKIKSTFFQETAEYKPLDFNKICLRLEAMKNAILIEDKDDIDFQVTKTKKILNSIFEKEQKQIIDKVISFTNSFKYNEAINLINEFTSKYRALIRFIDEEITALKLEARVLEIQISSLEDEVSDIEKLIHDFEIEYNKELGELILKILMLRREKHKEEAKKDASKQNLYEESEKDFNDFKSNYDITKSKTRTILTEEEVKELKEKFRKASKYCHPDVVSDALKEDAEIMFVALKDAYDNNDIEKVRSILNDLEKGIFDCKSAKINESNKMKVLIANLRQKRVALEKKIRDLQTSPVYKEISAIENWKTYLTGKKASLLNELEKYQQNEQ